MQRDAPLRLALVAPPWYRVPPPAYGGIEALVYWLAEGLAARGHQVTVIGAGERGTSARFIGTYQVPPTGRLGQAMPELLHAAHAACLLADLDVEVVHDHSLAGPLAAGRSAPTVLTAHGPVVGELGAYYRRLGLPLVAISEFQRRPRPNCHGLPGCITPSRSPPSPTGRTRRTTACFLAA